jgi:hypothetical protein
MFGGDGRRFGGETMKKSVTSEMTAMVIRVRS